MRFRLRLAAGLFLLLLSVTPYGCDGPGPVRFPKGTPIVVISVDTLRSDRLPAYGYASGQTPAIDRLAADGILFEHAYTHVPLTLPAHLSLLTGLLPTEHGVRDNAGYRFQGDAGQTVAGLLNRSGYSTGAAVSSFVLRRTTGLDVGFEFYDDTIEPDPQPRLGTGRLQRSGEETLQALLPWLRSVQDRPWFLLYHIFEPHTPYTPPQRFASRFDDPYDGEIAAADAAIATLIDELERLAAYDRSMIVLLSDHGEGLGDHGEREHGVLLYRESIQVPLIVKLPGQTRAGERVARPVQLIDVAPTLLEAAGIQPPAELDGRSLLVPGDDEPIDIYVETFYPRLHFGWSELTSMVRMPFHYIQGARQELYDLAADPAEVENLAWREAAIVSDLSERLASFDSGWTRPGAVDPGTLEKLATLGYVGTAAVGPGEPLPDPGSRIDQLAALQHASALYGGGDYEAAEVEFRALLQDNPRMLDAWDGLARSLQALGRPDEALDVYRRAPLELTRGTGPLIVSAAQLALGMGRIEEARREIETALEAEPQLYGAHLTLAMIAEAERQPSLAEKEYREELAMTPGSFLARSNLARLLMKLGRAADAAGEFERAVAVNPHDPGALLGWGEALTGVGRLAEAEAAFERAVAAAPDSAAAWNWLGATRIRLRRFTDAVAALRRAVELDPDTIDARANIGLALIGLNELEAAGSAFQDCLERQPDHLGATNGLAAIRTKQGRLEEAERLFRRSLELAPGNDAARSGLAEIARRREAS